MNKSFGIFCAAFLLVATTSATQAQKTAPAEKKATSKSVDQSNAPVEPMDPQIAVQMADEYFNAAQVMTADFVQTGADGRRAEGKLYVLKPGRLRFEYAQPATMEIIADGTSVAIRDRKLQTQEIYFISQTPLKFLLKSQMKLEKDVKIIDVSATESGTLITVEDSTTFGGTSRIKLNFDNTKFSLTQWEVTDPQGYVTSVTLHNVDLKTVPEKGLFRIPSENVWPSQN